MNVSEELAFVLEKDKWDINDLEVVAYSDLSGMDWQNARDLERHLESILEENGTPWDDRDPQYPCDPYLYGYELEGKLFVTGYSGVAGAYWNGSDYWSICKPY